MNKQSEAKERQQYTPKLIPGVCSNCKHFSSVITQEPSWAGGTWTKETLMRCGLGGFKVKKMGSCSEHAFAAATDPKGR